MKFLRTAPGVALTLVILTVGFIVSNGLWLFHATENQTSRLQTALVAQQGRLTELAEPAAQAANGQTGVDSAVVDLTPTAPTSTTIIAPVVTLIPWPTLTPEPLIVALVPWLTDTLKPLLISLAPWLTDTVAAPAEVTPIPIEPPATPTATPSLLPTATVELLPPTLTPLPTDTPPPAPTAAPIALEQPVQPLVELTGFRHYWQTWNNCGPATLAMNLSYYGSALDQSDIGGVLRTHEDDKNVKPEELTTYARSQGYQADVRINGNTALLQRLVSNGIPVLIETWVVPEPDDGLGHYRLITGYNEAEQYWIGYDSYYSFGLINPEGDYRGIRIPYSEFDQLWAAFNRLYIVVYPPENSALVQSILGADFELNSMWQQALVQAQTATEQQPEGAFNWFNLGSALVTFGDYANAAAAFDRARQLGLPWRMDWYLYEPLQAYYETGRYADILAVTDLVLEKTPSIEDIHYWRGRALAAQGQIDVARQAWQQALDLNPNFMPARDALNQP